MKFVKTFDIDTAEKIKAGGFPCMTETVNRETVFVFTLTEELSALIKGSAYEDKVFFGEKLLF